MNDASDAAGSVSLSELQLSLMRVLWARGEASVAEVVDALRAASPEPVAARRPLAHTTVATLLTRLARRGLLAVRRDGRTLWYRPLLSERDARRSMVGHLLDGLFAGRASALVSHLLDAREIGDAELTELQALLRRHQAGRDD